MQVNAGKKIYFLSDFHLGAPDPAVSLVREKRIVHFLSSIQHDAAAIFVVGDLFDFWYEYKTVVPKGYVRILGKLAEITDSGIPVYFFTGNHDMWMSGYFEKELNIPVYHEPKAFTFNDKKFLIGHGDGLGPGDHGYKLIKKIFRNKICQYLFGALHPTWGMGLANYFSRKSRAATGTSDEHFLGEENEWLITHCKEIMQKEQYDYFVFGHRHLPIDFIIPRPSELRSQPSLRLVAPFERGIGGEARYINLGDWIKYNSYAVFDGERMELNYYKE